MVIPIALLGIIPAPAGAQSRYLDRDASGIGLTTGFTAGGEVTGFSVHLGYASRGRSDIGITVERLSGDIDLEALMRSPSIAELFEEDIALLRVAPAVAGYPIKQGAGVPVSVGVGCAYVEEYCSGGRIDDSGLDVFTRGMAFSLSIERKQSLSGNLAVHPTAGISYHRFKATAGSLSGAGSSELYDYDTRLSWSFSLGIALRRGDRSMLICEPAVRFDDDDTTWFGVRLGFILPAGGSG